MRFCPFCAQENSDEGSECAHCGRRLPVLAANQTSAGVRALAAPAIVRAHPVRRPLPRPRPVTPSRELERPIAKPAAFVPPSLSSPASVGPVRPGVVAAATAPEAARTTRTGTLLGIATITDVQTDPSTNVKVNKLNNKLEPAPTSPGPSDEGTRIDPSPFDGPTTQTGDVSTLPDMEQTLREARSDVSRKRPPLQADEDPTNVRLEKTNTDEGPTQVGGAPFGFAPTRREDRARGPGERSAAPPMPLPPPPAGNAPHVRVDPPEVPTDVSVRLPSARLAQAEALPPIAPDGATPPSVPPMPPIPGPGLVPALKYLAPLAKAVWERYQAQGRLRASLHEDQRAVDQVLHQLGEAAWKDRSRPAELRDELGRADEDEERRRNAENEVARLDMSMATERERFSDDEQLRKTQIAGHEAEIVRFSEDLKERHRAKKTEEKALKEVDARYGVVKKKLNGTLAKAAKAEITPPEKGGGPNAAANLRREAESVKIELDGFAPERETAEQRVLALDEPIATLTKQLADERAALENAKVELAAARQASTELLVKLTAERAAQEVARTTAEKNIRLRLVSTGTLISLHRLDGVDRAAVFGPIYTRLDELQAVIAAREQQIAQLEQERRGYDKAALQRGLIVIGAAIGVFVILLVTLLVLLGRRQ